MFFLHILYLDFIILNIKKAICKYFPEQQPYKEKEILMMILFVKYLENLSDHEFLGDWCEDVRDGFGVMIYKNEHCYEGEWLNDKRSGWGRMSYSGRHRVYVM